MFLRKEKMYELFYFSASLSDVSFLFESKSRSKQRAYKLCLKNIMKVL